MKYGTLIFLLTNAFFGLQAQSITIDTGPGDCYVNDIVSVNGTTTFNDTVRNTFTQAISNNGGFPIRIIFSITNNRWEIQSDVDLDNNFELIDYVSDIRSVPNPPSLTYGNWQNISGGICGNLSLSSANGGLQDEYYLPVVLISFESRANTAGQVELFWATAEEINSDVFEIERSVEGKDFIKIGTVKARGTAADYFYRDIDVRSGVHYYRLKQLDMDGTFEYSPVIAATTDPNQRNIRIFPTTTKNQIFIETPNTIQRQILVFNAWGQLMSPVISDQAVDLTTMPPGIYFVQVKAGLEKVTARIIKD